MLHDGTYLFGLVPKHHSSEFFFHGKWGRIGPQYSSQKLAIRDRPYHIAPRLPRQSLNIQTYGHSDTEQTSKIKIISNNSTLSRKVPTTKESLKNVRQIKSREFRAISHTAVLNFKMKNIILRRKGRGKALTE